MISNERTASGRSVISVLKVSEAVGVVVLLQVVDLVASPFVPRPLPADLVKLLALVEPESLESLTEAEFFPLKNLVGYTGLTIY